MKRLRNAIEKEKLHQRLCERGTGIYGRILQQQGLRKSGWGDQNFKTMLDYKCNVSDS